MAEPEAAPKSEARPALAWAAIALAALCLGRWGYALAKQPGGGESDQGPPVFEPEPPPEPPPPPPYLEPARRLLGGLDSGDELGKGWTVDHVEGPLDDERIRVVAIRGEQRLSVWIEPRGSSDRPPPVHTERWDLFYDRPDPPEPRLGPGELAAVINSVAKRVASYE